MKEEFNFQGLNKVRTAVLTALFTLPVAYLTVRHYGALGAMAGAVFTGTMAMRKGQEILMRNAGARGGATAFAPNKTGPSTGEQYITDKMAERFGLAPLPLVITDDAGVFAATDSQNIYMNTGVARTMSYAHKTWTVAHEMDHVRNDKADQLLLAPLKSATKISIGAGVISALGEMTNTLTLPGNPSLMQTATITAASVILLTMGVRAVQREIELRCDANGLRATGDLRAAQETLLILDDMSHGPRNREYPLAGRIFNYVTQPFSKYPFAQTRLQNLEKTQAAMWAESAAGSTAPRDPSLNL